MIIWGYIVHLAHCCWHTFCGKGVCPILFYNQSYTCRRTSNTSLIHVLYLMFFSLKLFTLEFWSSREPCLSSITLGRKWLIELEQAWWLRPLREQLSEKVGTLCSSSNMSAVFTFHPLHKGEVMATTRLLVLTTVNQDSPNFCSE